MKQTIQNGLSADGMIPGKLNLDRRAKRLYETQMENETESLKQNRLLSSYAYAINEENASGGVIVTAPTCGASGVLPAVLNYIYDAYGESEEKIIDSLAVAGLIGNIVKTNASISGAECGCQAEIGSACSMASAALAELFGLDIDQIEYAAEVAMEHHLGLTCDPIDGLVQIPCIERNAHAAARALDANIYATYAEGQHRISYDKAVQVMKKTGHDLPSLYRETSEGGLAVEYHK